MSLTLPHHRPSGLHVPAGEGETRTFSGDVYTVKLEAGTTNGSIGLIEASVPPGGGPPPHVHEQSDEIFYLLSGELEFLDNDRTFVARAGDLVFVPRGGVHRFTNIGVKAANMLFLYTPGGPEGLFLEAGDEPQPGVSAQPWGPERFDEHMTELSAKYRSPVVPPSGS
ncbi:cupin domain-containing protein [Kineosporia rhizophila]|uniref:cupin domain-containing protein n=1 Tax=Kineosporia rhizophila TaxID=84633 RepID=UPI000B297970|nr:cupin domain-containing protein [Kineosporia rhizophila]MCE0538098.1 cupin domain-containing protein [Kineosporia rhizophila]